MKSVFNWLMLISAVAMVIAILLQQRGSGLGAAFGGDSGVYRSRRGVEKILFQFTIAAALVFVLSVILTILSR